MYCMNAHIYYIFIFNIETSLSGRLIMTGESWPAGQDYGIFR